MRILIVEDNRAIAANLYDYLESQGHRVDVAHDGIRGFQLAAKQEFDAVLLDLGLPRMDGMALCSRLRQEAGVDTPVGPIYVGYGRAEGGEDAFYVSLGRVF